MLLPPAAGCAAAAASPPPTIATAGQAIPLLTHTPCYSAVTANSHRSEAVIPHSPLCAGFRCRVVLFLGLAVVHRHGALRTAWSRNDFHRESTVRGEADSWVHDSRKELPPYYTENNYSST